MKTTVEHVSGNRYQFDSLLQAKNGWAQIDTKEDAPWYGNWSNPVAMKVVHFVEGDLSAYEFETPEEFVQHLRGFADACDRLGYGPMKIDHMCQEGIINAFRELGLADLLH